MTHLQILNHIAKNIWECLDEDWAAQPIDPANNWPLGILA